MRPGDVTALLELKRVRERRAAATLAESRRKERMAVAAEAQVEAEARRFARQRAERENEVRDRLACGPQPARTIMRAGAALAELSAHAHRLRRDIALAVQNHAACAQARTEAERHHARTVRDSETFRALHDVLEREVATEEQQAQQDELDEIAGRRSGHEEPAR